MDDPVVRRLFLSWCHTDQRMKDTLTALLTPNLRILRGVELQWWEDSDLHIGEDWRRRILARLGECDYGVLLHERPHFGGELAAKGALPVALKQVPLDGSRDLHGVDRHQIFTAGGRAFAQLRGSDRDRFAVNLATAVRARVLADA